jgi:hypothetical protein
MPNSRIVHQRGEQVVADGERAPALGAQVRKIGRAIRRVQHSLSQPLSEGGV